MGRKTNGAHVSAETCFFFFFFVSNYCRSNEEGWSPIRTAMGDLQLQQANGDVLFKTTPLQGLPLKKFRKLAVVIPTMKTKE